MATDQDELPRLEKIHATGIANGIEDMERLTAEQIKEIEPFCEGIAGVRVGCTGIIDFRGATEKMASIALALQPLSWVSLGEGGTKEQKKDAAKVAGRGRFGAVTPPRLVANNG